MNLKNYKCAIVVGHEEKAQGANSVRPLSLTEYKFNTQIAEELFRILKFLGFEVKIFFRDQIGISGAYKEVNEWTEGAEKSCAVELHFNAANGKAQGTETLYDEEPKESLELAQLMQEELCLGFGRKGKQDRGVKLIEVGGRGHRNLALCKIPSCIVEPFFGDNPADAKLAHEKIAEYPKYLARGIIKFFLPID